MSGTKTGGFSCDFLAARVYKDYAKFRERETSLGVAKCWEVLPFLEITAT